MKIANYDILQAANTAVQSLDIKNKQQPKQETGAIDMSVLSKEGKVAVKMLDEMGVSLDDADAKIIDKFMLEADGSLEEKLAALTEVIKKELPLTDAIINDINCARKYSLADFIKAPTAPTTSDKKVAESLVREAQSHATVATKLDKLLGKLLDETKSQTNRSSEKVVADKQAEQEMFAIDRDKQAIDEDFIDKLRDVVAEIASQEIDNDLGAIAADLKLGATAQMYLEQTVTPRLAEVKQNFERFKSESLTMLNEINSSDKTLDAGQKIEALSKLIDKMDNAIMKSEIGLYIDMQSEKTLLKQSSDLADARAALVKGELLKAEQIVTKVLNVMENLDFKPTIQKAIAVGNPLNLSADDINYNQIVKWAKGSAQQFTLAEKSPALLLNYLRRLGINHEAEVFQKTFAEENAKTKAPRDLQNLKSLLLALAKTGKENELAEKVLTQINGQQMNLKLDDKAPQQNLMLSIPMSMNALIGDVKVFIKSQQENLKADWRNFNMFFILDTKRFGEVGIKVASIDKNLSIDIKNDNDNSKAVIEPLAEELSAYVEEIGFNVASINFNKLLAEHPNRVSAKQSQPIHNYIASDREFDVQI